MEALETPEIHPNGASKPTEAPNPSDLAIALSLAVDAHKSGNLFHGWRVALAAHAMALELPKAMQSDVFYAGLLHDVGGVASDQHVTHYLNLSQQIADPSVRSHPVRGSSLVRSIPGLGSAPDLIRSHHEWWSGCGYPDSLHDHDIPLGAQLIRVADAADVAGCFGGEKDLRQSLNQMHTRTGQEWSKDVWAMFLHTFTNGALPKEIMVASSLPELVSVVAGDLPLPSADGSQDSVEILFQTFARVVDAKHLTLAGHSDRVADWAVTIGKAMGYGEHDLRMLKWAGHAHDIGQIAVPTSIMGQTRKLAKDEIDLVRAHAHASGTVFRTIRGSAVLQEIGRIISHHHERYDGLGYPDGLSGESIPRLSRILAVVDAYDAMTSPRSFRPGMAPGVAIQRLQLNAGTQFDPQVVDAVVELFNRNPARFLAR